MRPAQPGSAYAGNLAPADKVSSFAADIIGAAAPFAVRDPAGALLGEVMPDAVLDILTGGDQRRNAA
jgi:glycine betaine/proline transport system ATP-binding protein